MSFTVLVIPEDPTLNGHILKPLTKAIVADAGRPAARVTVLTNPKLGGYDQAVNAIRSEIAERYRHMDLWLFFPDADKASDGAMRSLEGHITAQGINLLCCIARPEVEIYACAAFRRDISAPWQDVRSHPRLKEVVFAPLLAKHGDPRRAGGGRDLMTEKALANLPLLFQLCPELQTLRDRLAEQL